MELDLDFEIEDGVLVRYLGDAEELVIPDCVTVIEGKDITVKFDRPTPLQVDGETVLGVTEYTAKI